MNGQFPNPSPGGHVNGTHSQGGTPIGPNFQIQVPRIPASSPHYRYDPRMHPSPGAHHPTPSYRPDYSQQNVSYSQYNQTPVRPTYTSNSERGFSSYSNPPAPMQNWPPPVDYQRVLLSLAEEFFTAAYAKGSALAATQDGPALDQYYKLIATGLSCLESALKVSCVLLTLQIMCLPVQNFKLEPNAEAVIRLRYAQILFQETEHYPQAEEALSNGVCSIFTRPLSFC